MEISNYLNCEIARKGKKSVKIETLIFSFIIILVFLFPVGLLSAYIPYFLIGFMFISLLIINKTNLLFKSNFLFFTIYGMLSNFVVGTLLYDYSIVEVIRTSLFFIIPFMSIYIGKSFSDSHPDYDFKRIALFLLFIELVVCVLQITNGTVGYYLTSMFGSEKYYMVYNIRGSQIRAIGTLGNPNCCGIFSTILTLIIINNSNRRNEKIMTILAAFIIILATSSRTALIALIIVLCLSFSKIFNKNTPRQKKFFGLLLALIIAFGIYFFFGKYVSREISISALDSRIKIWDSIIENIYNTKIEETIGRIFGLGVTRLKYYESTDNEYLFFLLSVGFLGVVILLISIIKMFITSNRFNSQRDRTVCLSLMLIWFFVAITSNFYTNYLLSFVAFAYYGLSISKDNKKMVRNI